MINVDLTMMNQDAQDVDRIRHSSRRHTYQAPKIKEGTVRLYIVRLVNDEEGEWSGEDEEESPRRTRTASQRKCDVERTFDCVMRVLL